LYILLTILSSDILGTCPNKLKLWALISLIMLLCFTKWSNSFIGFNSPCSVFYFYWSKSSNTS
jgi:hypothetical protein